jgi:peptidyl-prolyl cis-trans isomerase C
MIRIAILQKTFLGLATLIALSLAACKPPTPAAEESQEKATPADQQSPAEPTPAPVEAVTEPVAVEPPAADDSEPTPAPEEPAEEPTEEPTSKETSATPMPEIPDVVATVNGTEITRAELEEIFNAALQSSGANPADIDPSMRIGAYNQLLQELVMDKLVSEAASGVEIPEADIDAEIEKIQSQFPTKEIMDQQLAMAGLTIDKLRDNIRNGLRQQRWMQSQVSAEPVTEEAAEEFYSSNQQEFEQPETVEASHILFMVEPDASDDEVEAKKQAAISAAKRASDGEDFNELAKELSEEPGADQSGGNLGFFPRDRMVPEFAEAAFTQELDTIGEPVRTQFGWHVIKVTDKKDAGLVPFEEVKDQISSFLKASAEREQVQQVLEKLKSGAKVETFLPQAG